MSKPTPGLELFHWYPSRSAIARWMLEEVGAPYDVTMIDITKGEQRSPEYLSINPMGKVPTLRHGETIVSETPAICCYLADAFADAGLAPAINDPRRGTYLKWLFFTAGCIEPAIIQNAMGWSVEGKSGMVPWGDYDRVIETLESALKSGPWLLGEQFTAADVVVGAEIDWGLKFKTISERDEFVAYAERVRNRPAHLRQLELDTNAE